MSESPDLDHAVTSPNQAISLAAKNKLLTNALTTARIRVEEIQERLDALTAPPLQIGIVQDVDPDPEVGYLDVVVSGRALRVAHDPEVGIDTLNIGDRVLLNDELVVTERLAPAAAGEIVAVKEVLDGDRLLVGVRAGGERVVTMSGALRGAHVKPGETVVCDLKAEVALAAVERTDVEELVLEEVPNTDYAEIGGLGAQIAQIRDAIELPFRHPELYRAYGLRAPKGILLYGPPGTGKTLIAKAVATSLTRDRSEVLGDGGSPPAGEGREARAQRSYFLNVKGPELLNKFVGETERQIRLMFASAREKAAAGVPVVIFFDEMEALFRTRGTGLSSDVETTVVPQLLAEIDGVEGLENVIVIGASNREDMIDPAILRPGRLDAKIRIDRPDAEGAREIFSKYLTPDLPLHAEELTAHGGDPEATVAAMIDATVDALYARTPATEYLEISYADGSTETLYVGDFASGAMIANIVNRAKKAAVTATLREGEPGIRTAHLLGACEAEAHENEYLPSASDPDEWARVSGRRGERVTYVRSLVRRDEHSAGREPEGGHRSDGLPADAPAAAEGAARPRGITEADTGGLL